MQYLMDALAILTGGLIKDIQSLILGVVVCAFIAMALDLLKDFLLLPAFESLVQVGVNPVAKLSADGRLNVGLHHVTQVCECQLFSDDDD